MKRFFLYTYLLFMLCVYVAQTTVVSGGGLSYGDDLSGGLQIRGVQYAATTTPVTPATWTVSVTDSLSVALYAENYVKGSVGTSAKWYDAQNPAVFASQSVVASMPTLVSNYVDMPLGDYLVIASLPTSLANNANTVVFAGQLRDNSGSYIAGVGPVILCGDSGVVQILTRNNATSKMYSYAGGTRVNPTIVGTESVLLASVGMGSAANSRMNSGAVASGGTGITGLPLGSLRIGQHNNGTYRMDGKIYSILIYNRILSNAEVTTVFNELAAHYGLTIP